MAEPVLLTFNGVVRRIGKTPEERCYNVIFQRQAAFYRIPEDNLASVKALSESMNTKREVTVTHNAQTMEIVEAKLFEH